MRNRLTSCFGALLVLSLVALVCGPAFARPADDETTEDVIVMNDMRELHGYIVSESPSEIVFEFVDRKLNLRSKLTLKRADIVKITRDVAIPEEFLKDTSGSTESKATGSAMGGTVADNSDASYGIRRAKDVNEHTKRIYIVPMEGQMGTDINTDVYKGKILDDIRAQDPDYIVFKLKCMDEEDRMYTRFGDEERNPFDSNFLDMYRDMVSLFRDELRDIPQVLWVEDSVGISSVIAMAWPDMYMTSSARLGGLAPAAMMFESVKEDENKYGKYREAMMGWLKGFAEYGKYDLKLVDAMVRPEFMLSASWKGREVDWALDTSGEYLVDGNEKATTSFRSKTAEDFCISKGTADSLDDLALLLGVREYVVVDGIAVKEFEDHKEAWRRALEQCIELYGKYEQYMGWANGEDTVRYLGQAIGCLEKILQSMERYKAVEFRIGQYGMSKLGLITTIERMKEQLRAARSAGRGAGPGGTGGGGVFGGGKGR